jgi:hypothetical protein
MSSLLLTRTKITKKTSTIIIMGAGASTHTSTAVSHGSLKGANLPPVCTTDTTAATAGLQRSVQVKLLKGSLDFRSWILQADVVRDVHKPVR